MKMVKPVLFLLSLVLSVPALRAQTADEVIGKYFDAIGGKDKIAQIKSVKMESSVSVMGQEGPSKITILNSKGYRAESDIGGKQMIQVFTDKGGWMVNAMMGASTPQPLPEEMYKQSRDQIDVGGPLYNYAAKGSKAELLGKDSGTYKIKLTTKDSVETTFFIDMKSYYLTRTIRTAQIMGQQVDVSFLFSDFKKSDFGVLYPFAITISYGGQFEITTKITKIETNKDVDPKIFEMPKS